MRVNMHSSLSAADSDSGVYLDIGKIRTVPLHRLKVPQQMEESLIYAVYKRKPLWDPSVHFYRNNTVIKILWEEVANETGLTDNQAKARWKTLRDYYRLELKKMKKSEEDGPKKSNWAHFNSLSFLQDLMTSKKISGAEVDAQMADESQSSVEEMDQSVETEDIYVKDEESRPSCWKPVPVDSTSGIVPQDTQMTHNILNMRKQNNEIYRKALIDMERRRLDLLEKKAQMDEDDDLQYLKSLLPLIKMLPLSKKIGVRLKFQNIICKEIEEFENSNRLNQ